MFSRQQQILLELALADGPITSDQLAAKLGVSSRTIKSEMPSVAQQLEKNGAKLISKRNCGYSVKVLDSKAYDAMYTLLVLKINPVKLTDSSRETYTLYIARRLVSAPEGVKLDDLAQELYLSRSALRVPLQKALYILKRFHLTIDSIPGQGLRVKGEEHCLRLAMVELFGTHFHTVNLENADPAYTALFDCDYQQRQDIRHVFLKVLRESGYSLRDSVTQRIALYLVLIRNRLRAGYALHLPSAWLSEVSCSPLYALAAQILQTLSELFDGFEVDASETTFLAIFILSNLDVNLSRDLHTTAPWLYDEVCRCADGLLDWVRKFTGANFHELPDALPMMRQLLLPMLAGQAYGIDGLYHYDYAYEKEYLTSPVCLELARLFALGLRYLNGCLCGSTELSIFAFYVSALIAQVSWPIRRLRLVATNFIGTEFARIQCDRLKARYPDLIETITPMELYEIRKVHREDYDAVLLGNGNMERGLGGYNYEFPMVVHLLSRQGRDDVLVYNQILVQAYQAEAFLPSSEQVNVVQNFRFSTATQLFQFMAQRYAKDEESRQILEQLLTDENKLSPVIGDGVLMLFGPIALCRGECLELYPLRRAITWGSGGPKLRYLLFLCQDWSDLRRIKTDEAFLNELMKNPKEWESLVKNPLLTMHSLLLRARQTREHD